MKFEWVKVLQLYMKSFVEDKWVWYSLSIQDLSSKTENQKKMRVSVENLKLSTIGNQKSRVAVNKWKCVFSMKRRGLLASTVMALFNAYGSLRLEGPLVITKSTSALALSIWSFRPVNAHNIREQWGFKILFSIKIFIIAKAIVLFPSLWWESFRLYCIKCVDMPHESTRVIPSDSKVCEGSCSVLYCIVLYCIVLYCIVLYCIVLYCIVLYCIVLYCIVLYCIV